MNPLKAGTSIDRVVEATEINYVGYLRGVAGLDRVTWCETPEITWFTAGLSEPWFNRIVRFRVADGNTQRAVDSAVDIFESRNRSFQWSFGPAEHRIGLGRLLEARGGRSMGENVGMAVDLGTVPDHPLPAGLELRPVDDPGSASDWRDVLTASFALTPVAGDIFRNVELNGMGPGSCRMSFVAYSGTRPVSIGTLHLDAGVAGVLTIATIPDARKQGIGKAVTRCLLRKAGSRGYHIAVLMASAMGAGVYRSLGFRKTCDFHRYEFTASESG